MRRNLLLLTATLLIMFFVGEKILKWHGRYLSYEEESGSGDYFNPYDEGGDDWIFAFDPHTERLDIRSEFTTHYTTNNEGLNDRDIDTNKTGKRLLVFGDSFVEGIGAPLDSSYPRILENIINQCDSGISVINCGVSSSDIFFEYFLLKFKMQKYQPDFVLVTLNSSDYYDFIIRGGFTRFVKGDRLKYHDAPWFEPLYANSYIVRHIVHGLCHLDYDFLNQDERTLLMANASKEISQAIDSFQLFCARKNIKLGVVFQPRLHEIKKPSTYPLSGLVDFCQERGIPYIDEMTCLNQNGFDSTKYDSIFWPIDTHPNSHGYGLLAKCVSKFIVKNNWVCSNSVFDNLEGIE